MGLGDGLFGAMGDAAHTGAMVGMQRRYQAALDEANTSAWSWRRYAESLEAKLAQAQSEAERLGRLAQEYRGKAYEYREKLDLIRNRKV